MKQSDIAMLAGEIGPVIKGMIEPLTKRIAELEEQLAAAPKPEKGEPGKDGEPGAKGDPGEKGEAGPQGEKGDAGANGEAGQAGQPGRDGKDGAPGPQGEKGRDGLDVKDMFRAEGGRLMAVMTDGTTKDLGVFVGKDGLPGKDGADGVGFDDMEFGYDGERTVTFKFARGERVVEKSFEIPVVIDRGVFTEREYAKGDAVSHGGSVWIAQSKTSERPGTGDGWRLAVKKGRDGKDGVMREPPEPKPVRLK